MPFTNNDGIKIHYVVEGAGPPLVLHHGTFGSWEHWQDFGYLDDLKRDHKLIMVDARGHGASDKPHAAAAYDLPQRVRDVTSVLDELGIAQANYFGFSLGGWIGFGLAKYAPSRLRSLIVGGAHPFEENMQPFRDLIPQDADAFFALIGPAFGMHMTPAI